MKKTTFYSVLFLFTLAFTSVAQDKAQQPKQYTIDLDNCDIAQQHAARMAANKQFQVDYYGIVGVNRPYEQEFRAMMFNTYNITFTDNGCVISAIEICRANAFKKEIEIEYGVDFVDKQYTAFVRNLNKE